MSEYEDFDVAGLAAYLHRTADQVQRMADRGRLPCRRINNQWRFSRAEIHHWLEDRIGASDETELVGVEKVLYRDQPPAAAEPRIAELLSPETIAIPLAARTKNSVIESICQLAAEAGKLWDPQAMAEAIRARESLHPTALENGVALLHPRRPLPDLLAESFLALGITQSGIPFGGPKGSLTDVFFLIASDSDAIHLKILARLSRLIVDPGFLSELRLAADPKSAIDAVRAAEEKLV
jgi:PTS system nitrogen regulatory IIA component